MSRKDLDRKLLEDHLSKCACFVIIASTSGSKGLKSSTKLRPVNDTVNHESDGSCYKCGIKCDLCANYLAEDIFYKHGHGTQIFLLTKGFIAIQITLHVAR